MGWSTVIHDMSWVLSHDMVHVYVTCQVSHQAPAAPTGCFSTSKRALEVLHLLNEGVAKHGSKWIIPGQFILKPQKLAQPFRTMNKKSLNFIFPPIKINKYIIPKSFVRFGLAGVFLPPPLQPLTAGWSHLLPWIWVSAGTVSGNTWWVPWWTVELGGKFWYSQIDLKKLFWHFFGGAAEWWEDGWWWRWWWWCHQMDIQ